MAPSGGESWEDVIFTWKEQETQDAASKVELLICPAGGIDDDSFRAENDSRLTVYLLEKTQDKFIKTVRLEPGTFQFLFRINDEKETRISKQYPTTFLSSGREVNFVEMGVKNTESPPRNKFTGDMFDQHLYRDQKWADEETPLIGDKQKKKRTCCGGSGDDEQCCCTLM